MGELLRVCEFCQTLNKGNKKNCMACGGPLPTVITEQKPKAPKIDPTIEIEKQPVKKTTQAAKKIGKDVDVVYRNSINAYSLFWRTLGEAIIIALVSFGIGILGGAFRYPLWTILFGIGFGVLVGSVIKSYLWYLIGTPVGFVFGGVIGFLISSLGVSRMVILGSVFVFSSLSVILGAHLRKPAQKNLYEKLRPILGGLGGLIFTLLGLAIGWGLSSIIG